MEGRLLPGASPHLNIGLCDRAATALSAALSLNHESLLLESVPLFGKEIRLRQSALRAP